MCRNNNKNNKKQQWNTRERFCVRKQQQFVREGSVCSIVNNNRITTVEHAERRGKGNLQKPKFWWFDYIIFAKNVIFLPVCRCAAATLNIFRRQKCNIFRNGRIPHRSMHILKPILCDNDTRTQRGKKEVYYLYSNTCLHIRKGCAVNGFLISEIFWKAEILKKILKLKNARNFEN